MPQFVVTSPDGRKYRVNAPAGSTQADAIAYVQQNIAAKPSLSPEAVELHQNRRRKAEADLASIRTERPSFMAGVGRGAMDIAQGLKQSYKQGEEKTDAYERAASVTSGTPITRSVLQPGRQSSADYTRQVNDEMASYERGRGGDAGIDWPRITGNVAATAPLALVGGPEATLAARVGMGAVQGTAIGGAQFTPSNTDEERADNATTGAVFGGALPAAGSAARVGIQILPRALSATTRRVFGNGVVDAIQSPINARWNQRLFNEVTPQGEISISGPQGFQQLGQRFTDAYEKLWNRKIKLKNGEVMDGKAVEKLDDDLRKTAMDYMRAGDRTSADGARASRQALRNALPDDVAQELTRLDDLYANYSVLRRAGSYSSGGARGAPFTPAQLLNASRALDRSAGKAATAQGTARMQPQANARLGGYSQPAADAYANSQRTQAIVDALRRYGRPAFVSAGMEDDE